MSNKTPFRVLKKSLRITLFLTLLIAVPATSVSEPLDKPNVEEIIAKHLASIGSDEARAGIRSRTIVGTCRVSSRGRKSGATEGIAVLASDGAKSLIGMKFPTQDYPYEKMGYDGKRFSASYIRPGVRTALGDFLLLQDAVFKEGLAGGTLSSAWPLLNLKGRNAEVEYAGTRKIAGRQLYVLRYLPRKGNDLNISLFFETETFRHVRTEYEHVVAANIGSNVDDSSTQRETRYKLVEIFSDFNQEDKLILPHTYELQLSIEGNGGIVEYDWLLTLQKFIFNPELDASEFKVDLN